MQLWSQQIINKRMFLIYFQFFIFCLLPNTFQTARQAKLSVCNGFLAFLISLGVIVEFMRNFKAITIIFYGILIHRSTACETCREGLRLRGIPSGSSHKEKLLLLLYAKLTASSRMFEPIKFNSFTAFNLNFNGYFGILYS